MPTPRHKHKPVPVPGDAVYISAVQVLARYGNRSMMWLHRILANDPDFPRPKYIGRLRFFSVEELEDYERRAVEQSMAERDKRAKPAVKEEAGSKATMSRAKEKEEA